MHDYEDQLSSVTRSEGIDVLTGKLLPHYAFPAVAAEMVEMLRQKQSQGAYDAILDGEQFAMTLTAHLREVSKDRQLVISYNQQQATMLDGEENSSCLDNAGDIGALFNFGFEKVERLPGNIGYLSINTFFSPSVAVRAVITTMDFITHTHALIIDLRHAKKGEHSMVNFLASYFFPPEPVHLSNIYWRASNSTQQFWTLPYTPGQRYLGKQIYILTSQATLAAAEEFAYDLQSQQRATIIGTASTGEANPLARFRLSPLFDCQFPIGYTINPITGTNWEGTGVIPDIATPPAEAFKTAYILALKQALKNNNTTSMHNALRKEIQEVLNNYQDDACFIQCYRH